MNPLVRFSGIIYQKSVRNDPKLKIENSNKKLIVDSYIRNHNFAAFHYHASFIKILNTTLRENIYTRTRDKKDSNFLECVRLPK